MKKYAFAISCLLSYFNILSAQKLQMSELISMKKNL